MEKVAVIGGGISGLAVAQCLKDRFITKIFECASKPGGLIKCDRVNGNLYHMVGGHVFNSRRQDVLDWFWQFFDREEEFTKAVRNAVVFMSKPIGYPIEDHIYQIDSDTAKNVIDDLLEIERSNKTKPQNFAEFLRTRFGQTLYDIYFKPYNEKIWKRDLSTVPIEWLVGKLPMPTVSEIIFNNIHREKETNMVHSTFYYAKNNGSQFLADRLAQDLDIEFNNNVHQIVKIDSKYIVNDYECDKVVFCGNIKNLPSILNGAIDLTLFTDSIEKLEYHGTTTVLCEIEANPFSWIYLPDTGYPAHRIICTGNFSKTNNATGKTTASVEFTDMVGKEDILRYLKKLPFSPKYLDHRFTEYTYPIQNVSTRSMITNLKSELKPHEFYLLGRFSEWEYYNMDAAIGAAIDFSKSL